MTSEQFIDSLVGHCLGWRESMQATYMMARDVIERGIPGDFVEAGVYAGAESAVMARAIMDGNAVTGFKSGLNKRVHLFDSFQGIPQPGPEDSEFLTSGNPKGDACCPLDGVKENMRNWGIPEELLLVYHPGWFEDTMPATTGHWRRNGVQEYIGMHEDEDDLPESRIKHIALLRLDSDLYESTKTCMQYLYPLVSRGGWVIVDDYQLSGCRKAVSEVVVPMPMYFEKL